MATVLIVLATLIVLALAAVVIPPLVLRALQKLFKT